MSTATLILTLNMTMLLVNAAVTSIQSCLIMRWIKKDED